jgi:CheY-like chemotaxis protein
MSAEKALILLVDDNRMYRESVRRNLEFEDYRVVEAQDMTDALEKMQERPPDLMITDLDMKTPTEGLDLIRQAKSSYPLLPVIMISAVGTFDEGALAREYGAAHVISKSRVDKEIDSLYYRIEKSLKLRDQIREIKDRFDRLIVEENGPREKLESDFQDALANPELDSVVKGVIYDMVLRLRDEQLKVPVEVPIADSAPSAEEVRNNLKSVFSNFDDLEQETARTLVEADRVKAMHETNPSLPAERMTSFAYCFAVENEVKHRIGRKVVRFLGSKKTLQILGNLYSSRTQSLDLFFNRELMFTLRKLDTALTVDLVQQVLARILQHGERYKPDGLKALGVILFCFGREYACKTSKGEIRIENPLAIRGIGEDSVVKLASRLIQLQHLRNPYIHPEFTEREQIDRVREIALECIDLVSRIN